MEDLFIGSEAVRSGVITGYQLRTLYRPLYPDVYVPAFSDPTLRTRTVGAWLWSKKRSVVAGLAAAALHGSRWIDDGAPIELIWRNTHPPEGGRRSRRLRGWRPTSRRWQSTAATPPWSTSA